jgi:transposase
VGADPVDRGKPGSKLHLVCDGGGLPLTAVVTAANVNDTTMFQAVVDDVPPIRTPSGRRRTRPGKVHADKAYDSRANRAWLRQRGIRARIARRGVESSTRLGRHRWRVERSLSWLSCWRRLQVRWDRDAGRWVAFVLVACAVVCFNRLQPVDGSEATS